ncbi:MarR family winged helix-turn-helix transcriptional regulator [Streptomyces sp. NPDC088810]|uniref:MarR family winged helix-turn-helix transcriptional regulator n=1 Tax=unclassified Streptomyces TaxID=2593676 RepID=UPI003823F198
MKNADDLTDYELIYLVGMTFQLLLGEFVGRLNERGYEDIRPIDGMALQVLKGEGATGTELAAALGITKQAVSGMVTHLEERGYVMRVQHPSGGRRQLIQLTEKAYEHLSVAGAVLHDLEAEIIGQTGKIPMYTLRMTLAEMITTLSGGRIPPLRPTW